eukprot:7959387-Lingulodinium_polyedra.AAC.1
MKLSAVAKVKDKDEYSTMRDMIGGSQASGSEAPAKKRKAAPKKEAIEEDPKKAWIKWSNIAVKTMHAWQTANLLLKDQLELRKDEDWCSPKVIEAVSQHYDVVAELQAKISKMKAAFTQDSMVGAEHEAAKQTFQDLELKQTEDKGVMKRAESLLKVMS